MSQKIIRVQNLIKRYKKEKTSAVDDISFDVDEGEFFAFLGPNGAGKTTTISILTTLLSKTSGLVEVAGFDVDKKHSEVRSNIGIIFQNPSLDLNLTAEENIRFHAVLYGIFPFRARFSRMPKEYRERVRTLAEILGIQQELNKPVKTFSGGMKRKLEILRSLIHSPKILFLDEPTTGLDPASRKGLWEYLKEVMNTRNTTVFLTTHYLEEAEGVNRLAIINNGKIVANGSPARIKTELVKDFVLMDSKDRKTLLAELKTKNRDFNITEDGVEVLLDGNGSHAQKLIKEIDTTLSTLEIHTPTLEEAYLEIISDQEDISESTSNE